MEPPAGDGRLGALRHLTPERVVAAASLVRTGTTVSLGRILDTQPGPENPSPAEFRMTVPSSDSGAGVRFSKEYVGVDYHNDTHSHVDALNHVVYDGVLYGGTPASATPEEATAGTVEVLAHGLEDVGCCWTYLGFGVFVGSNPARVSSPSTSPPPNATKACRSGRATSS